MVSSAQKKRDRKAATLFKLVSSTTRVSILSVLAKHKQLAVQDIADALSMTHSAVSHQLGRLSRAGIVEYEKDGRNSHYSLSRTEEARSLARFLAAIK